MTALPNQTSKLQFEFLLIYVFIPVAFNAAQLKCRKDEGK